MKKIIVIGGGASGLVAAINAAKCGNDVIILEKNNICGKKILITGNGRCNYYNKDQKIEHYRSKNIELVEKIITKENTEKIVKFFKSIGIEPKIKNGYYYPYSNQAVSIQNALLTETKNLNIEIKNNIIVNKINKENDKFIIYTNQGEFNSEKVIIATGSKAAPKTGSDGSGYKICMELGHTIIKPLPALVQLKGNEKYFKEWSGIRVDANIKAYENNNLLGEETGELQLTDYGISGICVMNLSGRIARGLNYKKQEYLKINFLQGLKILSETDFIDFMNKRNNMMKNRNICELLEGIINYKLVNVLLKICNIKNNKYWSELSQNEKLEIAKNFIDFRLDIVDTNSFDKAQICSGGIPLTEIDLNTMESLKTKGLYLTGEILDVDGDCGGYNLTWAWISGMIAGCNV